MVSAVAVLLTAAPGAQRPTPAYFPDAYNVRWDSPGRDAAGSIPIGNGEVGLNVWVEPPGDLVFYVARTDAWSEISRLLKLGRIRVRISPNPFVERRWFRQDLRLRDGRLEIQSEGQGGSLTLRVFVDAQRPVIHIVGESDAPHTLSVTLETWRNGRRVLTGDDLQSTWTMQKAPPSVTVWESGDVVEHEPAGALTWYHRNAYSVVPQTLQLQGLSAYADLVHDPLAHRTFGGRILADGLEPDGPSSLKSKWPSYDFHIRVATHSAQTRTIEDWKTQLTALGRDTADGDEAMRTTAQWWDAFWRRSWIVVEGDGGDAVTRAYVLQRWMTAIGGRGNFPIKFNGSIFTVDPAFSGGPALDPDWRRWGDAYWWQNTRLPYFGMLARGDVDELSPLFRMYEAAAPLAQARVRSYTGADGVTFPETMTIFGTWSNRDYGWDRTGHRPGDVLNEYIRHIWQQGLELLTLMLDYYDHTLDERFLEQRLVPFARQVLRYFDTRFPLGPSGRYVIEPTQAVETYWYGVVNDLPTVAGLRAVSERLLALPDRAGLRADRALWQHVYASAPPLPTRTENGATRLAPAERFDPKRSNVENVELYAVWPFGVIGLGRPGLEMGLDAFRTRRERASNGWQYDGQVAAALGLADDARDLLVAKAANANPRFRFPAMWGPNYDWLPDQCHGANIMLTLQAMLLRVDGRRIDLAPAWPKTWNARFRLHAPARTVIEGEIRDGQVVDLRVTPPSRLADVVVGLR